MSGNSVSTLADFNNLKTQLGKINPTGVQMDSYSPTNQPASCPSGSDWDAVATPLPPTPNAQLCKCMVDTLGCVVNPNTNENNYGDLFGYVCGNDPKACNGIAHNASTGAYGAYGMCSASEQLSYVFNQYYKSQGSSSDACSFKGAAQLQQASSANSQCQSLINQAGTQGTGTVTSAPSSNPSSSSSQGAAFKSVQSTQSGLIPALLLMGVAALSGMGMIIL